MAIKLGLGGIQIKMSLTYSLPNSTSGVDTMIVEVVTQVPSFIVGFLMFIWFFVFMSGISLQKTRTGSADISLWALISSLSTLIICTILGLKEGMMSIDILGIVTAITILCSLWFFLSKRRGEN